MNYVCMRYACMRYACMRYACMRYACMRNTCVMHVLSKCYACMHYPIVIKIKESISCENEFSFSLSSLDEMKKRILITLIIESLPLITIFQQIY